MVEMIFWLVLDLVVKSVLNQLNLGSVNEK